MGNNRTVNKFIFTAVFVFLFVLCSASVASAKIQSCVTEDEDGKCYEYDYDLLRKSYAKHLLGFASPLFSDYNKKTLHSFLDDKNGYVDYENVRKAYARTLLEGTSFDVDNYTASSEAKKAAMPAEVFLVSLDDKGELLYTPKTVDAVAEILAEVNGAATVEELEELITARSPQLGLNLADYGKLGRSSQTEVLNRLLAKRPGQGFASLEQFKVEFNSAVAAVKPTAGSAMQAVNGAASAAAMGQALLDHDAVLELNLTRYSLTGAEQETLGARLLALKPFASPIELRRMLHVTVISIRTGYTVHFTGYGYTLSWMLGRQMSLGSPVTDRYGGGWKSALPEDVAYYLEPYNFIDMGFDGSGTESILITAEPNLRVRERPTTGSAQVKDGGGNLLSVWQNQIYGILGQAQAEGGTAPGTEGTWYRIMVSGKEGWVCGRYCRPVTGSFSDTSMFQFLRLSGSAGSTAGDLDRILAGKGILDGTGSIFMQAGGANNINEIFLVSLGLHETGNGLSSLATGVEVEDSENLFPDQDYVKVYNMFGIGAYDSNPIYHGAERAYRERWFTPEAAILGGAKFASDSYVNNSSYYQNTLYKMRWNPANPGSHQYATDIGWAAKQVSRIRSLYDMVENYTLIFDIPRYQE